MRKKYIVRLGDEERTELELLVRKGRTQAYRIKHANILLAVDSDGPNWTDAQVASTFRCHQGTVENIRRRFVEQGLDGALARKKQARPSRQQVFDGEKEARLIALACSKAPDGHARWSLRLLADELVVLDVVDSVSHETVRQTLKKTNSSRTCGNAG